MGDYYIKNRKKEGIKESEINKSLVADTDVGTGKVSINYRYPWEAFADVGFRCAISFNSK